MGRGGDRFEGAPDSVLDVFAVETPGSAGSQGFVVVSAMSRMSSFANVGVGDVDGALEDLEKIAAVASFSLSVRAGCCRYSDVSGDGVEVVFDDFARPLVRALWW